MGSLSVWKERGRYFRYKGYKIFYRRKGKGPLLLLIHGFPTASWDWHRVWPALTARFDVVAPDMIGFGFSDKPRRYAYSIDDQASLHEQLLEELNVSSCHILAHDYGDTVVQELLARQIERRGEGRSADPECLFVEWRVISGDPPAPAHTKNPADAGHRPLAGARLQPEPFSKKF